MQTEAIHCTGTDNKLAAANKKYTTIQKQPAYAVVSKRFGKPKAREYFYASNKERCVTRSAVGSSDTTGMASAMNTNATD